MWGWARPRHPDEPRPSGPAPERAHGVEPVTQERIRMICGKEVPTPEASDHYMLCDDCDRIHRERHFELAP